MATKKDAYYFSHDANAQDDPKCMLLIDQLGMEGYGIFWALIEKLRSEKEYRLPFAVIPSLARRWGTSKEKVETVVNVYGLFELEDNGFFSARLIRSMREKSEQARINAAKRWPKQIENMPNDAAAYQPHTDGINPQVPNDAIKVKESKEKEIKENKIKVKERKEELTFPFGEGFLKIWGQWKEYKKVEHRFNYKSIQSEQAAINELVNISGGEENRAIAIIQQSLSKGWKGFFQLKNEENASGNNKQSGSKVTGEQLNQAFNDFYSRKQTT